MRTDRERRQVMSAAHYVDLAAANSTFHYTLALAAARLGSDVAMVNIIGSDSLHTVAAVGMPLHAVPRAGTMCDEIVRSGRPMATSHIEHRFAFAPDARAYLGVPITGREGVVIGTLSLLNSRPQRVTPDQLDGLVAMAAVVEEQLEMLRRRGRAPVPSGSAASTLAEAVDRHQIVPFYQPLVDLGTGRVTGFEALARWEHPDRGLLAPAEFIPLAEDTDIILELDRLVIGQAFQDVAPWLDSYPDLGVSVNLSKPSSVTLEVTETVILAADPGDRSQVIELRDAGFRIVLDDFGTGFSSFEHVLRLPIDGLKLDREVTRQLGTRAGDAVTRSLVGLARDLELALVIEGVETRVEADIAQRLGCGRAQGYLWSVPVPASEVPGILGANHWHPELSAVVPGPARSSDRTTIV